MSESKKLIIVRYVHPELFALAELEMLGSAMRITVLEPIQDDMFVHSCPFKEVYEYDEAVWNELKQVQGQINVARGRIWNNLIPRLSPIVMR